METLKDRQLKMRDVLLSLQAKKPFEDFTFEDRRILKECYDAGYFEGIVLGEAINGRIFSEYRHDPRLTYKGLQFLDSLSEQNESGEPDPADHAESERDISKQSLQWTKIGVVAAIIIGVLTVAAALLPALLQVSQGVQQ